MLHNSSYGLIVLFFGYLALFCHATEVVIDGPAIDFAFGQNTSACYVNNTLPATNVVFVHFQLRTGQCALSVNVTDPTANNSGLVFRYQKLQHKEENHNEPKLES